jgi:flavin reductase (DIM6/NTAB) family NADH-FMN oxidoreductase RutF
VAEWPAGAPYLALADVRPEPFGSNEAHRRLRTVLGNFATGVTVVSVGGEAPHAMTANAFTAVSLDPALVLVCVDRDAVMHGRMQSAAAFAVSVLAADQEDIARHFANRCRPRGRAQFERVAWTPGRHSGAPLIRSALAWLECELWRAYDGGDHSIYVGRVLCASQRDSRRSDGRDALVFFGGRFHRLAPESEAV